MLGKDPGPVSAQVFAETAYLFRHAVLREAAYQLQPPTQRSGLHAQVVEIALQVIPADQHDALALELADHAGAAREHLPEMAAHERHFLARAAEYAKTRHLPRQALGCLERLIALEPDLARQREHLLAAATTAAHFNLAHSAQLAAQCIDLFDGTESATLRCDALRLRGQALSQTSDFNGAEVALRKSVEAGLAGDPIGAAKSLAMLGTLLVNNGGRPQEGMEALAQASAEAGRCGDNHAQLVVDTAYGAALVATGKHAEAQPLLEDCLRRNEAGGTVHSTMLVRMHLVNVHRAQGRHDEAERSLQSCIREAQQTGLRQSEASLTANLGVLHFMHARLEQAEGLFRQALALHEETGNAQYQAVVLMNLGNVASAGGKNTEAMDFYQRALALHRATGNKRSEASCLTNLGTQRLQMGDAESGLADLVQAIALHRQTGNRLMEGASLLAAGQALLLLGRLGQSESCVRAGLAILEAFPGEEPWAEGLAECARHELLSGAPGLAVARVQELAATDPKRLTALRGGALLVPTLVRAEPDPTRRAHWLAMLQVASRDAADSSHDVRVALNVCRELRDGAPEFRGFLPRELTAACRRALVDRMAATEPESLEALRTHKPEVWQAMTHDALHTPLPDWRDSAAV